MSRRPSFDDALLENALRELAPRLAFPPERDLSARVTATIHGTARVRETGPRWRLSPRVLAFGTAALVVVASLSLALSPAAREAVADFLGIGGVRIEVGPGPTPTARPGKNLSLGVATTLDGAQERVDFDILLPTVADLAAPDEVYVSDFPSGGRVSLVYHPNEELPEAQETGLGLLVTEFIGTVEDDLAKKLSLQLQARPTDVNGTPAFWVRGPHTLFFLDADGMQRADTLRLSGNALIWTDGDTTLRIESALGLEDTLRIAESMR